MRSPLDISIVDRRRRSDLWVGDPRSANDSTERARLGRRLPLRVLSGADFAFWQRYGYVIVKQAVRAEQVKRTTDFLWAFQDWDANDVSTWNRRSLPAGWMREPDHSGMVEAYQHQTLWDNRQTKRVYDAFVDIWDREDLWVSIDRASLITPSRCIRPFSTLMQWDSRTRLDALPVNLQGVLALSNTCEETGGFHCIREMPERLKEWRTTEAADRDPCHPDVRRLECKPEFVAMEAGDLLIFNSRLAHGLRPNTSADKARLAQYIAFMPANEQNSALRRARVDSWRDRTAPKGFGFPGDPREWEQIRQETATLTPLGERILGSRSWFETAAIGRTSAVVVSA